MIKPDHFLSILNQTRLPFLNITINKRGTKTWMDIYNKPTESKQYVPFMSNHPPHCLTNIPLSLARKICTIFEEKKTMIP